MAGGPFIGFVSAPFLCRVLRGEKRVTDRIAQLVGYEQATGYRKAARAQRHGRHAA